MLFMPNKMLLFTECHKCGKFIYYKTVKPNVCPHCGAKIKTSVIDAIACSIESHKKY